MAHALNRFTSNLWQRGQHIGTDAGSVAASPLQNGAKKQVLFADDEEPSVFSLQIGAFDNMEEAQQEVLDWQAKGEDSFVISPKGGESRYRVFVGRFENLTEANAKVDQFADDMQVQAFITLISASGER